MNFLAHSLFVADDPYEIAGAAAPDWLPLTRPRVRCRSRSAAPYVEHPEPAVAALARGIVRHHADDDWFHNSRAFAELELQLARAVRLATRDDDGMRPKFLGHILVELLLDAALAEREPELLDRYYDRLAEVDPSEVARRVSEFAGADAGQLGRIIPRFCELRFLFDYADDQRLVFRLNQVMQRVRLPELPESFAAILPEARIAVAERTDELLAAPAEL
ncbi:MAG: hypothetical protein KF688_16690 [Pirellulales bacterium]|nr:hypothetical protein [Pirellulales bacterium]